ncbi:MAG: hypothetical protein JWO31_1420, partial [Phycisphaerales bacterium]|nr:hypothetical protein [Phycisphaerales bacterium]
MSPLRLIRRNLSYFRAASLAVVAGTAVATAVLAGSLMVGDSVRGSLRQLAVQRLGPADYALVANRFFDDSPAASLAKRVAAAAGVAGKVDVAPAVVGNGAAAAGPGDKRTRTGDVQVLGVGAGGASAPGWPQIARGQTVLNGEAADALGVAAAGPADVTFTLPSREDVPRESTVARRSADELSFPLRASAVAQVARDRGLLSLFSLAGGQRTPRNAWVNLADLQDAVQQPGRANVLLATDKGFDYGAAGEYAATKRVGELLPALNAAVRDVVTLGDYGLDVTTSKATGERVVSTKATYLDPPTIAAAMEAGKKLGVEPRLVTVNLVNRVVLTDDKGNAAKDAPALHYVIGAGVSRLDDGPIGPDEIAFNQETADQLKAKVGDRVRLDYYRRDADGKLAEVTSASQGLVFRVAKILPMAGVGNDAQLTPTFKGLTDSASVADWNPPAELKIDTKLAEKDNDAYWRKHKAAPRLLVHVDAARKMWGGPWGDVTSVRVPADKGDAFADVLRRTIDPAALGFAFQPVKLQQL